MRRLEKEYKARCAERDALRDEVAKLKYTIKYRTPSIDAHLLTRGELSDAMVRVQSSEERYGRLSVCYNRAISALAESKPAWIKTTRYPNPDDPLPLEDKRVLVWHLGAPESIVGRLVTGFYGPDGTPCLARLEWATDNWRHGPVAAWCDCLPDDGPEST